MKKQLTTLVFILLCCTLFSGCEKEPKRIAPISETQEKPLPTAATTEFQPAPTALPTLSPEGKTADTSVQEEEAPATSFPELTKASFVRTVDGDTIIVKIDGEKYRVRLIGINTPESVAPESSGKENTEEGREASDYTKELLKDTEYVWLQKDTSETDKFDRLLRYVWLEVPNDPRDSAEVAQKMLNGILVRNGYAEAVTYKPDTAYQDIFEYIATMASSSGTEDGEY